MGRKLEIWEKEQREREKEYERQEKSIATEHRRLISKINKQEEFELEYQKSKKTVEIWESFYYRVCRLQLSVIETFKYTSTLEELYHEKQVTTQPVYLREITFVPLNEISKENFIKNDFFDKAKVQLRYSLDDYCKYANKKYISFLKFLFKGVINEYNEFISERIELIKFEENRRNKYFLLIDEFKNLESNFLNQFNEVQQKEKENFITNIKHFNKELNFKNEYFNKLFIEFKDVKSQWFYYLLLLKLPIIFFNDKDYEDIFFLSVGSYISNVYKSKSKESKNNSGNKTIIDTIIKKYNDKSFFNEYFNWNLEPESIGIQKVNNIDDVLNIYIVLPENHFPLKDIRYTLLKEKHSSSHLTIKQRDDIEDNFYPALAISYVHYFFKFTNFQTVEIHLFVNGYDLSTGNRDNIFLQGYQFDRTIFQSLSLEMILPSEAIKNFTKIKSKDIKDAIWSNNDELNKIRLNPIFKNLNFTMPRNHYGLGEVSLFSEQLFNAIKILCENKEQTHSHIDLHSIKETLDLDSNSFNLLVELLFDLNIIKVDSGVYTQYYDLSIWDNFLTKEDNYNKIIENINIKFGDILKLKEQIKELEKPSYKFKSKIQYTNSQLINTFNDLDDAIVSKKLKIKDILERRGLDTSHIDNFLDEYYDRKM